MMFKPLKSTLTAMMLSAVAIAPVATVSFLATADVAAAKGKKEKSERGNAERGNKGQKGGKSARASEKGKKAKTGGNGNAKKFAASSVENTCEEGAEGCEPELRALHPSELGNMNGALHANENAILAHIRNGNISNGPVGHMAALAIAGYDRDMANELLGTGQAQEYLAVDDALAGAVDADGNSLGFESYADYQAYLDNGGDPIQSIDDAVSGIGRSSVDEAVASSEYDSLDAYLQAKADTAGDETPVFDANIELALANSGVYDPAAAENVAEAEGALTDYQDAMTAMQEYWNKGGSDSENADDLAAMLEDRLSSYENVGATIEEQRAEEAALDDETACDAADPECATDETALLDQ